jgi:hypothetical protein
MMNFEVFSKLTVLHVLDLIVLEHVAIPENDECFILEVSGAVTHNSRNEVFLVLD